jgi:hypothetical protein
MTDRPFPDPLTLALLALDADDRARFVRMLDALTDVYRHAAEISIPAAPIATAAREVARQQKARGHLDWAAWSALAGTLPEE